MTVAMAPAASFLHPQNELAVLELIHCFVEVLDKHFGQVCELDIMNEPDVVSGAHKWGMGVCGQVYLYLYVLENKNTCVCA
jgi:hypothetical protein